MDRRHAYVRMYIPHLDNNGGRLQVLCAVCAIRGGEHTAEDTIIMAAVLPGSRLPGPASPPALPLPGRGDHLRVPGNGRGVFPLAAVAARVQQKRLVGSASERASQARLMMSGPRR